MITKILIAFFLALLIAGCTSYPRVNGALWGAGMGLTGPVGGAIIGAVAAPDIADSISNPPKKQAPAAGGDKT